MDFSTDTHILRWGLVLGPGTRTETGQGICPLWVIGMQTVPTRTSHQWASGQGQISRETSDPNKNLQEHKGPMPDCP